MSKSLDFYPLEFNVRYKKFYDELNNLQHLIIDKYWKLNYRFFFDKSFKQFI